MEHKCPLFTCPHSIHQCTSYKTRTEHVFFSFKSLRRRENVKSENINVHLLYVTNSVCAGIAKSALSIAEVLPSYLPRGTTPSRTRMARASDCFGLGFSSLPTDTHTRYQNHVLCKPSHLSKHKNENSPLPPASHTSSALWTS